MSIVSLTSVITPFSRLQKNFVLTFYRVFSFCMKVVKLFVDTIWANFIINDNNVPEETKAGQIRTITITIEFCFLNKQAQKINIICQITLNFRDLANYSLFLIKKEPKSVYIIKTLYLHVCNSLLLQSFLNRHSALLF